MSDALDPDRPDARLSFDAAYERLRPDLHRFCTRLTGSPCDGEDALQEATVAAFDRASELRDEGALRAWLYRIAHNKCIDLMRRRRRVSSLDDDAVTEIEDAAIDAPDESLAIRARTEQLLVHIASTLPPKERACIVLKDVLDCSLEETAAITGSTLGAVKAALHRGREKLVAAEHAPASLRLLDPSERVLARRYVDAFNARDWDAVRALVSSDAELVVVRRSRGPFARAPYFSNYEAIPWSWRLELALVDGVEEIVHFREVDGALVPHAVVRLEIGGQNIVGVRDWVHVADLLTCATVTPSS